jgi:hypothetical protein
VVIEELPKKKTMQGVKFPGVNSKSDEKKRCIGSLLEVFRGSLGA